MQNAPSSYAVGSPEEAKAQAKDRLVARALFGKTEDRAFTIHDDLKNIPKYAQTQRPLDEQLSDARAVLNRLGLYDAADYLFFEQKESRSLARRIQQGRRRPRGIPASAGRHQYSADPFSLDVRRAVRRHPGQSPGNARGNERLV